MSLIPCVGRWDVVTGCLLCWSFHLPMHFFIKIMSKEEIQQQILDAITSGKIQVTNINFGDHVEHQHKIEKVEAGGVGFQFFEASKINLPRPKEGDYNGVREYIEARKKKDPVFKQYCQTHQRKQLCERLSDEFGWIVDDHHLGVNIGRNK